MYVHAKKKKKNIVYNAARVRGVQTKNVYIYAMSSVKKIRDGVDRYEKINENWCYHVFHLFVRRDVVDIEVTKIEKICISKNARYDT